MRYASHKLCPDGRFTTLTSDLYGDPKIFRMFSILDGGQPCDMPRVCDMPTLAMDLTMDGAQYGARYGAQYGAQYGAHYSTQYCSRYGSRYGTQYGSRYGSQYGAIASIALQWIIFIFLPLDSEYILCIPANADIRRFA